MGILNQSEAEGLLLGVTLIGLVFTGGLLRVFFQIAGEVERTTGKQQDDEVVCKCFSKRCSAWLLTVYCTITAVTCYFVDTFFALSCRMWYFFVCDECPVRQGLWSAQMLFCIVGYTMLFVTHFQRLRLTFLGSVMELPKWASKVMYGVLLLFVVLFGALSAIRHAVPTLSALMFVLVILLYFAVVCVFIRVFFKKTLGVANTSPPDAILQEVAVRMSIIVTLSLLSTTLNFGFWAVILGTCPNCHFWWLLGYVSMIADQCFNAFCLICAFGHAATAYQRVFGGLHARFLLHLNKTAPIEKRVLTHTRMSNASATANEDKSHDADNAQDAI